MKIFRNIAFFFIIGIVFFGLINPLKSQSFSYHSDLPFNIDLSPLIPGEVTLKLIFYDRDNDKDLDLFLMGFKLDSSEIFSFIHFEYFIDYQENIGTRNIPDHANRKRAFDSFYFPDGPFLPSIGDLNNDNKLDFIAHAEIEFLTEAQSMIIYQNIGDSSVDEFEVIDSKNFGLEGLLPWSFLWPELVDLDSDGDLDILSSGNIPADFIFENLIPIANYAKNIGTPENPEFNSWFENPYNIKTDTLEEIMKAADLDNDGDVDILSLVSSNEMNTIHFKENQMNLIGKPNFEEGIENPFGLPMPDTTVSFIDLILADFNGDGDVDVYILTADNNTGEFSLALYENDLCVNNEVDVSISENSLSVSSEYEEYQWIDCDTDLEVANENASIFQASISGNYAIEVIDANGCLAISDCYEIIISETIETNDLAIRIFPNPNSGIFVIDNPSQKSIDQINVYDLNSKLVGKKTFFDKQIDCRFLPDGTYMLELVFKDQARKVFKISILK
jgi:hypothetical protein